MVKTAFLVPALVAALLACGAAWGQSLDGLPTVVVGGSGRMPVEVNLDALGGLAGPSGAGSDAVRLKAPRAKPRKIAAAPTEAESAAPAPSPRPTPRLRL
ncbi:MAG: hypothetical protein FJX47_16260, partial [Alphaproteobacteria bacterium]|nr:hypothetical protein [Alphaproteobacteria bacterium]